MVEKEKRGEIQKIDNVAHNVNQPKKKMALHDQEFQNIYLIAYH